MKKLSVIILLIFSFTQSTLASFVGKVIDSKTKMPISNAVVVSNGKTIYSNEYGKFSIDDEVKNLSIRAYGYRKKEFQNLDKNAFELERFNPKALYLSYWAVSLSKNVNRILKLIEETEANTVVIDMKSEYGYMAYKGDVKLAKEIGAYKKTTIKDIDKLIAKLKAKNVYLIARNVVFKDELLTEKKPEFAIKSKSGKRWINREKLSWSDPFIKEVHKYNVAIAKEVAKMGFDEINFDYIRFPGKASLKYKKENTEKNRVEAISSFLKLAKEELAPYNVFISVDTFGYACWNSNDIQIGHSIKAMAKYADYIAPMLYPSSFHMGIPGAKNPMEKPYEIINHSLKEAKNRFNIDPIRFRPWLQSFKDYAFDRRHFGLKELKAQIDASEDFGTSGWMLWNPSSKFSLTTLQKFRGDAVALNDIKHN